jgi:hypothetical protein
MSQEPSKDDCDHQQDKEESPCDPNTDKSFLKFPNLQKLIFRPLTYCAQDEKGEQF